MTTDDELIAYLSGEGAEGLDDAQREDLDELRGILGDPAVWAEPDPALEDAVVAAIAQEAGGAPRRAEARVRASRRSWLRPQTVAAGAVGLAAAVLLAVVVVGPDSSDTGEQLAANLVATDLVPGAHGEALFERTESGWRIELDATGLPRLDDGRFYQAWLKGPDDLLVAIGTFNEGEDVVLWAGVPPTDYPTITVTEEAADGDPASSGRRVLVGQITG